MPRTKKQTPSSNTDKMSQLQSKIDSHKTQIANLEKRMTAVQKEIHSEAINELALFIERKHITVDEAKRLITQSMAKRSMSKTRMTANNDQPTV